MRNTTINEKLPWILNIIAASAMYIGMLGQFIVNNTIYYNDIILPTFIVIFSACILYLYIFQRDFVIYNNRKILERGLSTKPPSIDSDVYKKMFIKHLFYTEIIFAIIATVLSYNLIDEKYTYFIIFYITTRGFSITMRNKYLKSIHI